MNMQDYNAPIRYQPPLPPAPRPPGQRPRFNWKPLIIVCSVVLLLGTATIIFAAITLTKLLKDTGMFPDIPEAAVHAGTQLAWRELGDVSSFGPLGSTLVIGDFSGSGQDELLVINPLRETSTLYDLNGGNQQLPGWPDVVYGEVCAWDYDGDGRAEVVQSSYEGTLVMDRQGRKITELEYDMWNLQPADVDGDGQDELVVNDYDSGNTLALGPQAEIKHTYQRWIDGYSVFADVDTDGRDEMLACEDDGQSAIVHLDGTIEKIVTPQSDYLLKAAHRTTSGTLKLVVLSLDYSDLGSSTISIYDTATKDLTLAILPPNHASTDDHYDDNHYDAQIDIWLIDLLNEAEPQVAIKRGDYRTTSSLILCGMDGGLRYYEEFGEAVHAMGVAKAGEQQHLVVLTSSRVLIYP